MNLYFQERIKTDLKNLRDKSVFAFVMVNSLFVLTIFLLQLNQDQLHFKWPFGQHASIVYDEQMNVFHVTQDYLTLEPIGSLFIIFFGSIIVIQFTAMLFHRLGTLTHLLSNVQLNWYFSKKPDDMSDNALIESRALEIAKDLQRLNTDDLEKRDNNQHVSRRKTIHNLEKGKETKQNVVNLDANFKRRLTILQNGDSELISRLPSLGGTTATRRATLRALKTRRDSVVAERRRSQMQARDSTADFMFNSPGALEDLGSRASVGAYVNRGYEPALDSEVEDTPLPPRRSTPDDMSDNALIESRALEIAKDLQRLNTDDLEKRDNNQHVSRRKTIHNLEKGKETKQNVVNLDANFKRRLTILQNGDSELISRLPSLGGTTATRRATLRALKTRRDSVVAERRRSQMQARDSTADFMFNSPGALLHHSLLILSSKNKKENGFCGSLAQIKNFFGQFLRQIRASVGAYVNRGYEPALDSEEYRL
uniref:Uncharacterized protein n=1 Tax=Heliothis virescens TaxID=7102 RepID=A0A2A4K642_HELVI